MKWFTRHGMHVDRTASAWLIRSHIDPSAEFVFVSPDTETSTLDGSSFDMKAATFTHRNGLCTFENLLEHHGLEDDAALALLGRIVREADVPTRGRRLPEARGLNAIMRGFQLSILDDYEKLRVTGPVYDALFAYCREKTAEEPRNQATPRPRLNYRQRVTQHLEKGDGVEPRS
jgi:hypothetical protein